MKIENKINNNKSVDQKCLVNDPNVTIDNSYLDFVNSEKFQKKINPKKRGKVIFVNPSLDYESEDIRSDKTIWPYPGLMILQSVLSEAGYDAQLIDSNLYKEAEFRKRLFDEIDEETIFVGFGLMTVNVVWAYSVMKKLKERHPNLKILVGGFHSTLFPDQMINDKHIDIVAVNESASIILALTDAIKNDGDLSKINGIYYKKNNAVYRNPPNTKLDDAKNVPFINLDLVEHKKYSKNNAILFNYFPKKIEDYTTYTIITSWGCPFKCTFCINAILKRAYRYRTAEAIVDRIEFLIKEHNANFIILQDEEFCINKRRLFRFLDLVEERGLTGKFHWRTSLRVSNFRKDYIDDVTAKRLERSGMVTSVMGGESGSQRILDEIKKEVKIEEIDHAMETLSKTNIVPKISFMAGLPGETDEEVQETYELCVKYKKIFLKKNKVADIGIFPFRLYPGSPLYDKAVEHLGIKPDKRSLEEMCSVDTKMNIKTGSGYEPVYKKYLANPKRFEDMLFIYDYFIMRNLKRKSFVRNLLEDIAYWRLENKFYYGIFIEKFMVKSVIKFRNFIRWIKRQEKAPSPDADLVSGM